MTKLKTIIKDDEISFLFYSEDNRNKTSEILDIYNMSIIQLKELLTKPIEKMNDKQFNKIIDFLKSKECIQWGDYKHHEGHSSGTINFDFSNEGDFEICFDFYIDDEVTYLDIKEANIYNVTIGKDYYLTLEQKETLNKTIEELFDLDVEDYEHPSEHAFNIGE